MPPLIAVPITPFPIMSTLALHRNDLSHIVMVLPGPDLGGAERQALLLARHLVQDDAAQVTVATVKNGDGRTVQLCREYGIPCVGFFDEYPRLGRVRSLRFACRFGRLLRILRPDVVLPYCMPPNLLCGLSWKFSGAKCGVWNQRNLGGDRLIGRLERYALNSCTHVVANSQTVGDYVVRRMGVCPSRVLVIRNGIEQHLSTDSRTNYREQLKIAPDALMVTMVANFRLEKDHQTLLHAWRIFLDRCTGARSSRVLVLAGRFAPLTDAIKALAFDLELDSTVRFLGAVDDIPSLLGATDISVFSSHTEGSPNGVLESMAAGLPIVGSDLPAIREAVGPIGFPFLIPTRSPGQMAGALLNLASNMELRRKLGYAMRQRATDEYPVSKMVEAYKQIIPLGMHQRFTEGSTNGSRLTLSKRRLKS